MIYSLYKQNYNVFSSEKVAIQFFNFLAVFVSNISFLECFIYLSKLTCSFYSSILSPIWLWMLYWASVRIILMFFLCSCSLLLTLKIFPNFWKFFGSSWFWFFCLIPRKLSPGGPFFIFSLESPAYDHSKSIKKLYSHRPQSGPMQEKNVAQPPKIFDFLGSHFFSLLPKYF